MASLREKILGAQDIKKELKKVDVWDAEVEVRGLSGEKMFEVKKGATEMRKNEDGEDVEVQDQAKLYAALIIASVYDPASGEPVFKPEDRDAVMAKSFGPIDEVVTVAMRVSGLSKAEQKAIEKNSAATPNDGTTSA